MHQAEKSKETALAKPNDKFERGDVEDTTNPNDDVLKSDSAIKKTHLLETNTKKPQDQGAMNTKQEIQRRSMANART